MISAGASFSIGEGGQAEFAGMYYYGKEDKNTLPARTFTWAFLKAPMP